MEFLEWPVHKWNSDGVAVPPEDRDQEWWRVHQWATPAVAALYFLGAARLLDSVFRECDGERSLV